MVEPNFFEILEPRSVHFIDSRGTWGKKWYSQYRSDRTVSDAPVTEHAHSASTLTRSCCAVSAFHFRSTCSFIHPFVFISDG